MFLVHPTRLSKIFADSRTHPCGNARHRQASKLVDHARAKSRMRSPKMKALLKKNLPGRPYSAPAVARLEFCYHSLQEDQNLYITSRGVQARLVPQARALDPQNRRLPKSIRTITATQARSASILVRFLTDHRSFVSCACTHLLETRALRCLMARLQ